MRFKALPDLCVAAVLELWTIQAFWKGKDYSRACREKRYLEMTPAMPTLRSANVPGSGTMD